MDKMYSSVSKEIYTIPILDGKKSPKQFSKAFYWELLQIFHSYKATLINSSMGAQLIYFGVLDHCQHTIVINST